MSVTETTLLWTGQGATRESSSNRTYTATYLVKTDDEQDGPQVVLDGATLPTLYSGYSYGNDVDYQATLKSLSPSRVDGNRMLWHVTASWETPGSKKEDNNEKGEPTSDPTLWHDDLEFSTVRFQRPVEKAFYIQGYGDPADGVLRARNNDQGPMCNSAFVPFDPPLERDDSRLHIKIGKWSRGFPAELLNYVDCVNNAPWSINKPAYGFVRTFEKYTVKVNAISGTFQIVNNIPIWKVTWEFEYRWDDWTEEVLDRGLQAVVTPAVSVSPSLLGKPKLERITDLYGVPVSEPVLFDGKGNILADGQPPVYGHWSIYQEVDFSPLVF